jgi:glycosyltransferase involved in cell wall biosynthesis
MREKRNHSGNLFFLPCVLIIDMRIVLISRATLFTVRGGDTIQILQTAEQLTRLGIPADIKLTHEKIDYSAYDLLHFFNITRPADILYHIQKTDKPFVVSTILIDYSAFDKQNRKGIAGRLLRLLSKDNLEYAKCIARFLKGQDKLMTLSYLWMGQHKSIKKVLRSASVLFSNSSLETRAVGERFGFAAKCRQVSNGVDTGLFSCNDTEVRDDLLVICVARIEGIKNQLNLIKALNNTKYRLLLIGPASPNQPDYYRECRRIAASNIFFLGPFDQPALQFYYQRAKVHVLPSWFEACGLSSLEAAAMGCNIVISAGGYTREYYEDYAYYCDPRSPASIFNAVNKAASAGSPEMLREKILSEYTWARAAESIAEAYHKIIYPHEHPHWNIRVPGHSQSLRRI